jgi:hypothetical protein
VVPSTQTPLPSNSDLQGPLTPTSDIADEARSAHRLVKSLHLAFTPAQEAQLGQLLGVAGHLGPFQLERATKFLRTLVSSNGLSNWGNNAVATALELTETFIRALPDSTPLLDLTTTSCAALHFQHASHSFGAFLSKYNQIQRTQNFSEFTVAFRALTRHGCASGEDVLAVADRFKSLIDDPRINSTERQQNLLTYFRGLIWKGWDFVASLILLEDALDKQRNVDQTLRLSALSSTAGRADSRPFWARRPQSHVPAAVEFLAMHKVSDSELGLATLLYHRTRATQGDHAEVDATALRLFTLFEVCRYTEPASPVKLFAKVEDAILSGDNPANLIHLLTINQLRSQDNRTTQKAIEALIGAGSFKEFGERVELLRSVYKADVPAYPRNELPQPETLPLLEQQNTIFKEAMNAFAIYRQARASIGLMSTELRPSHADHPGLLVQFATEIANVSRVFCEDGAYPGSGIVISKIRPENVFELDPKRPSDPYHRYLQTKGWSQEGINDFLASKILLTDELMVISMPSCTRYAFRGEPLSAVFFRQSPSNTSGSQCLLVPTSLIDAKLHGCTFDFWDRPISSPGLPDLSKRGFYPEAFELEARDRSLPFFDIGSPTNIGGFSNARPKLPQSSEVPTVTLNNLFGLGDRDPWGNRKKSSLMNDREAFDKHLQLHKDIAPLVAGYSRTFAIFADRYCAFKRGDTPDNSRLDVGIISDEPPLPAGTVMLAEAYRYHCHLRAASASRAHFPTIRFFQRDRLHLGALSHFELDTYTMQLTVADGAIQLPTLDKTRLHEVDDSVVRSLCVSPGALNAWQLYVRPHLGGVVPFVCFD